MATRVAAAGGAATRIAGPSPTRGSRVARAAHVAATGGARACRKIVDTPFPFPWAQAVTIVLLTFAATAPFIVAAFTETPTVAIITTLVSVHTYFMLNEACHLLLSALAISCMAYGSRPRCES